MRKGLLATLSMAAAIATSFSFASPAMADSSQSALEPQLASFSASDSTVNKNDPACTAALSAAKVPGSCQEEITMHMGAARPATADEIKTYGGIVSADGTSLAQAAAASTVYIRSWYQEDHGLYYVNWKERQEGKFLYNGSYAWVSNRHGYTGGYHHCGLGYGIGYSVDNIYCDVYAQDTSNVQNYDAYSVSVLVKGAPIHFTHSMSTYVHGDGGYSQYWA